MDFVSNLVKRQLDPKAAEEEQQRQNDIKADDTKDTSLSGLVSTLVPALLVALVYFTIFLVLRRSQRRFYAPRTYLGTLREK